MSNNINNIKEIKPKIDEINTQISVLMTEMKDIFKSELESILLAKPQYNILVSINNHDFNDGDATQFSFYYEDLTIRSKDESGEEIEYSRYGNTNTEIRELHATLKKYFKIYDFNDFYETVFGDRYECVSFSIKNGKLLIG